MSDNNDNKSSSSNNGCGCGCVSLIIFILVIWALWFGLPIGDTIWNSDIFPPRIWKMNDKQNTESYLFEEGF